jgi:hypothetical protein
MRMAIEGETDASSRNRGERQADIVQRSRTIAVDRSLAPFWQLQKQTMKQGRRSRVSWTVPCPPSERDI